MSIDTYFIKENYKPNQQAHTQCGLSGNQYWNRAKIYSSSYYQFPVYKYASHIIERYGINDLIDVGCGVGTKLAYLQKKFPKINVAGIDQQSAIDYCRENYRFGTWYVGDFEKSEPSISKLQADLIICADVIEHLRDPDQLLKYIRRLVRRDGYIILSTPERDALRGQGAVTSPNKFHVREWNFQELEKYLIYHNFRIIAHFLQYPIRFGLNRIFFSEIVKRAVYGKPLKYNQVVLLQAR